MDAATMDLARLVLRQEATGPEAQPEDECGGNGYDGRMGVRISAIFVILVGSLFGMSFLSYPLTTHNISSRIDTS